MARQAKKGREDDVSAMFDLRHMIEKSSNVISADSEQGGVKKIHTELETLNRRVEELRDIVVGVKKEGESDRKKKVKTEIVRLLQENKKLNPTQLGRLLGLSRVRSNEYLREMEDEKILKGIVVKKKKFYMLESDVVGKSYEGLTK